MSDACHRRWLSSEGSGGGGGVDPAASVEPMTWSLLGRFFGLPLLIIGTIVGGAVFVVLLFGGPAAPERYTVDELLQALEASSGQKSAGILLPREKELWQRAVELSERLRNKETELSPVELETTAQRLSDMIFADLDALENVAGTSADPEEQLALRSNRLEFMIRALGRTELPEAIANLVEIVERGREPFASAAMLQLGDSAGVAGTERAVGAMTDVLNRSRRPETLIVASTAVSLLANPGDAAVVEALASVRASHDGEVAWSAALALARLGSTRGKSTLLDLLDRTFWESGERYSVTDDAGVVHRYAMPPGRVDEYLKAAVDAAARLEDAELEAMIDKLASDRSPLVQRAAKAAIAGRGDSTSG